MSRLIRISVLVATAVGLTAAGAFANIPDPALSDTPAQITMSPSASLPVGLNPNNPVGKYVVNVQGQIGAVDGSLVVIEFSPEADALISWCTNQSAHPIVSTFSDANGDASFEFFGGGCVDPDGFGEIGASFIAQVTADNIVLGEPSVSSPDAVNSDGRTPTAIEEPTCVLDGSATVGLADAVYHTRPIAQGLVNSCTKMVPPFIDAVSLEDAQWLTPYIKEGTTCNCQ